MQDELTGALRRLAELQSRIARDDATAAAELDALWSIVDTFNSAPGRTLVAALQCTCMHVQRRDFRHHALWRERLEAALPEGWPALAPADALRVLIGAGWAGQITPLATLPHAAVAARIAELLDPAADPRARADPSLCLHAAAAAARLSGHSDDTAAFEATIARAERHFPAADPAARTDWLHAAGTAILFLLGDDARGPRMLEQARELAAAQRLRAALFEVCHDEYFIRLGREGPAPIEPLFEQMLRALDPTRLFDVARRYHLQARRALYDATKPGTAFHFAQTAVDLLEQSGYPLSDSAMLHTTFAYACARHGDIAAGLAAMERVAAHSSGMQQRQQRSLALFLRAYAQLRSEPLEQSRALLQRAFAEARELQWFGFRPVPEVAARLVEAALRLDVEAGYARKLIELRQLTPPGYSAAWPWRLRIATLGRFEAAHDGRPLARGGKVPRKTLELLQYVAGSAQLKVAADRLTAALWPELEGDLARGAFRTALHRLRKLLGDAEAVQFDGVSVWLDPDHVWVDALAFERLVDATETYLRHDEGVRARECGAEAFDLYRGHFLADQPEAGWILAPQDRLRSRFIRLVSLLGEHLVRIRDTAQALDLYRKAIELDPLDEEIARRLMALLRDRGDASAAFEVFRALRQRLSIELGQPPSAQTQRLADSLRG